MQNGRAGAVAAIVFGAAGLLATIAELRPQGLGYPDTDDPAVSLAYLAGNADAYRQAGLAYLVMALMLIVLVHAVRDRLAVGSPGVALRTTATLGLFAAFGFLGFGVLRLGVGPLLYIQSLDQDWGEAAYLVNQVAGIHGLGQGAILTQTTFVVGVAVLGWRSNALPRWLCVLAAIPAFRLVGLIGPVFGDAPEGLWIFFMLSIPGAFVWFVLLGVALLRRPGRTAGAPLGA